MESRTMFYFSDRCDAFPASPMTVSYMKTLICDASTMTYCFCIPRDMNHPISDNFNNNTFYVIFTYTLLKLAFLGYKPLGYRFHSLWKRSSAMDRRCITDATKVTYDYREASPNYDIFRCLAALTLAKI